MTRQVVSDEIIKVSPIPNAPSTTSADEPATSFLIECARQCPTDEILQLSSNRLPRVDRSPTYDDVPMGWVESNGMQTPAAIPASVPRYPDDGFLMSLSKVDRFLGGLPVIVTSESHVWRLDATPCLNEASWMVGVPAAIGVDGEYIGWHVS
jgi:hypothetical protein